MRIKNVRNTEQQSAKPGATGKTSTTTRSPEEVLTPEQALFASYCGSAKTDKNETYQDHYFEHKNLDSAEYAFGGDEPRWQFMIRLDPNLQNLSAAAEALSGVLLKYKLNFKLFHPAKTHPAAGYDPVKDYTLTCPESFAETPDLDLDKVNQYRVGQELRVEIGNERFQYDAPTYKKIMLECIKALQYESVKFGCLNAPMGTIDVPCEEGIPPVISYGYYKPLTESESQQRYSVLPREEYNPEHGDDPLEGIKLNKTDFISAGIDLTRLKEDGKRRIDEQKKHIEEARTAISAELRSLREAPENAQYRLADKETLAANMPLIPEDKHQPYMDKSYIQKLSKLGTDFDDFLREEQRATCEDFESNPFAMAFFNTHPLATPAHLAAKDLKKMQILYLRLHHLEYEQKCLGATLLSIEGNLSSVFTQLSSKSRQWQANNIPLRQSILSLGKEMAKLPEAEQKSPLYMDIVNYLNNALPTKFRLENITSTEAAQDQSEEARKARLRTQLNAIAEKLHGKGPTWGKVLGALLIVGGLLLGGLCVAALIPSLGLSSLPGFTLSTWMVASGAGFFGFTAAVGVGACLYSRDTGPSKTVQTIAAAL